MDRPFLIPVLLLILVASLSLNRSAVAAPSEGGSQRVVLRISGSSPGRPLPPTRPAVASEDNLAIRIQHDVFAKFIKKHPDLSFQTVAGAPFSKQTPTMADVLHLDPSESQFHERVRAGRLMELDQWVLRRAFIQLQTYHRSLTAYNAWVTEHNRANAARGELISDTPVPTAAFPASHAPRGFAWGPTSNYDYDFNEEVHRYNLAVRYFNQTAGESGASSAKTYALIKMRQPRLPEPLTVNNLHPGLFGISDAVWEIIYRLGPDGRRHIYAWPTESYVLLLQTNVDMLQIERAAMLDAGCDPNRLPTRWDELYRIAYVMTDPDKDRYGFMMDAVGWHLANFLWQAGGDVLVPKQALDRTALPEQWTGDWHRSPGITTARFLRRMFNKYRKGKQRKIPIAATNKRRPYQYHQDFFKARCAMRLGYGGYLSLVGPGFDHRVDLKKVAVSPLPAGRTYAPKPFEYEHGADNIAVQNRRGREALWDVEWTNALTGRREPEFRATAATEYHRRRWVRFARFKRTDREAFAPLRSLIHYGDGWRIRATEIRADVLAISADVQRKPSVALAAKQFIEYYTGPEARRERVAGLVAAGRIRQVSSRYLIDAGLAARAAEGAPPAMELAVAESLHWGRPQVHGPCAKEALALVWDAFRKTIFAPNAEKAAQLRPPDELEDKPEDEQIYQPEDETEIITPLVRAVEALDSQFRGLPPAGTEQPTPSPVSQPPDFMMWLLMLGIAVAGLALGIVISLRRWRPRRQRPLGWDEK